MRPQQAGPRYENEFRGKNNLYGVNRKTMTISNAHYMFIFFPPDCHFFLISSPLPQSFSPRPRNPSCSLPFIATEIHSTCPLIGILLFLYLCIPLFIQNHMLMKSVIINLKYLIFRSVSASEGGWLEEQQRRRRQGVGRGGGGGRGWKESCCSISLICIRCFKVSSNQSTSTAVFFHAGLRMKSSYELHSKYTQRVETWCTCTVSFLLGASVSVFAP